MAVNRQPISLEEALKYRRQAADLLYDVLRFHEGGLSREQLVVVKSILDKLADEPEGFTLEIARDIDRKLLDVGLDTIP